MIVMKFGGTSIQDALCIQRVTEIVRSRLDLKPVLVFSAIGKTTRNLLNTAQMAAAGQYEQAVNEVDACCRYHLSLHKELSHHELSDPTESVILQYCREMKQILDSVFRESSLAPRQQDSLLAYGELMATKILTNFLNREGIPAFWMDARSLIITNTDFTRAQPVLHETEICIIRDVPSVVDEGKIPVIQGFIGSAENGETTTLGFEGSDFTASLIGSALNVSDIQIWKDVPGIMTADPDIIPNSFTVCEISYTEAEKLTQAGAKILHPDTLAPAREKAIPVHICHSRKPI